MALGTFWLGQIPAQPLSMIVVNQEGRNVNLSRYDEINLIMLGADNQRKTLTDGNLIVGNSQVTYEWPTDRSLFDKPGDYIFQLELIGQGVRDYTGPQTIVVRKLGGGRL